MKLASFLFCLFILSISFGAVGWSQIPRTLSYQGVLTDAGGTAKPDGPYSFTFRIYTVPSGGAALWAETQSLQLKNGLFSAILGSVTPLPDAVKFDRPYWLSVQPQPAPELPQRVQLTSVGYSFSSLIADSAMSVPANSITQGNIGSGEVVKSINNLHDNITLLGANGASVTANGDTLTITASGGGGGGIGSIQNTDNTLSITNPAGPTSTINLKSPFIINGSVGIGTSSPVSKLEIAAQDGLSITGYQPFMTLRDGAVKGVLQNAGGSLNLFTNSYLTGANPGANFHLDNSGNVGIGTLNPTSKVEIAAQDGLAITGYQPFFTLRDGNAGNARSVIQSAGGSLNLFTDSYELGFDPTAFMQVNNNGNVGVGTIPPNGEKFDVNGGSGSGAKIGIHGSSNDNYGVYGSSNALWGVFGESALSNGVRARTYNSSEYALYTENGASGNNSCGLSSGTYSLYATGKGYFQSLGAYSEIIATFLQVQGDLNVLGTKDFLIDHPLDPANKILRHSCIESNEPLLVYSGTVVTDREGNATIELPTYFEAINSNFRYQLTIVGQEFAQSRVSKEISNNHFSIMTDKPNVKVCWQVTGDRNDAYMKAHPFVVEEEKKPEERGKYYLPELFGAPKEQAINYWPPPSPDPGKNTLPLKHD